MSTETKVESLPTCQFDCQGGAAHDAVYDGKTKMGPWANMCAIAFKRHGVGLGTGRGQKLVVR